MYNIDDVLCELCWVRNVCCATDSYIDCLYRGKIEIGKVKCKRLQKAEAQLVEVFQTIINEPEGIIKDTPTLIGASKEYRDGFADGFIAKERKIRERVVKNNFIKKGV